METAKIENMEDKQAETFYQKFVFMFMEEWAKNLAETAKHYEDGWKKGKRLEPGSQYWVFAKDPIKHIQYLAKTKWIDMARTFALTHFGEPPKGLAELADLESDPTCWDGKGGSPNLPVGYAFLKGTQEQADEENIWDLVDEHGFVYVYYATETCVKFRFSGPVPPEYTKWWYF